MQYLKVKNLDHYQHYKDRDPKWIKLYYSILDDEIFMVLNETERCRYMTCLIIASRTENKIPHDPVYLKKVMRLDKAPDLSRLISLGFLIACESSRQMLDSDKHLSQGTNHSLLSSPLLNSSSLALNSLPPNPNLKSNGHADEFEQFWLAYPKKVGKKKAELAWKKATDRPELSEIIGQLNRAKQSEQWMKDNGQFIPHPSTWLNEGRWADQPVAKAPSTMDAFLSRQPYRKEIPT